MANRFNTYVSQQNYAPESFKDMAVAPIMLRQRHDALLNEKDKLLLELENTKVQAEDQPYFNKKKEEIKANVDALTDKINRIGAGDTNLMSDFRNAKRSYNSEMSLSGGIGKSAALRQNVESMKDNYYKFALTQGQSPKNIEANWNNYYKDYFKDHDPENLGDKNFVYKDFNPTFAPKSIDVLDIANKAKDLVGQIKNRYGDAKVIPVSLPSGEIGYQIQTPTGELITDAPQLKALSEFMKQTVMNPASPEMEHLRYVNPGVKDEDIIKEFLGRTDKLINEVMPTTSTTNTSTLTGIQTFGDGYGSGGGTRTSTDKESDKATLTSIPTGQDVYPTGSMHDIVSKRRLKEFELKEQSKEGLTEKEASEKNLILQQENAINKALKDPNVISSINKNLRSNGYLEDENGNPSNLDGYKKTIEAWEKKRDNYMQSKAYDLEKKGIKTYDANGNPSGENLNYYNGRINKLKEVLDEAYKSAIPEDMLKFSRMYTFGWGKANNEAKKIFDDSTENMLKSGALITYMGSGGGEFTLPDEEGTFGINDVDKFNEFKAGINSGDVKISMGSFYDLGTTGDSKVSFEYQIGAGEKAKKGTFTLDYNNSIKDTSMLDNMFDEIQPVLDTKGKTIIQSFKDNKKYKDLSVDSRTGGYVDGSYRGYSDSQDSRLKKYSADLDRQEGLNVGGIAKEYANVNYIKPERQFNMYMNSEGFYETEYRNTKSSKESYSVSFGQWADREFFKLNKKGLLPNSDINKAVYPYEKQMFSTEVYSMVVDLMGQNPDGSDAMIQLGGEASDPNSQNAKARELIQKYSIEMDNASKLSNSTDLQFEISKQFLEETKQMRIAHRNKKRFL